MFSKQRPSHGSGSHRLDRRTLVAGSAAALVLPAASASAQHAHQHASPASAAPAAKFVRADRKADRAAHGKHARLAQLARDCLVKGEACYKHCMALLDKGDTSLVDCLKTVVAMMPICRALERYAIVDGKRLKELAQLAIIVNEDCAAECRKHADHHATCKACEDACRACIEECRKLAQQALLAPFSSRRFALTTHEGKAWTSTAVAGQPVALFFGYTRCPDVCPTTLMELTQALGSLGAAAQRLNVLFVTVDPERDTASHLNTYLKSFDKRIVGLTGNAAEIMSLAHAFGAHAEHKTTGSSHTVDHSVPVYLVDRSGNVVDSLMPGMEPGETVRRLRGLVG